VIGRVADDSSVECIFMVRTHVGINVLVDLEVAVACEKAAFVALTGLLLLSPCLCELTKSIEAMRRMTAWRAAEDISPALAAIHWHGILSMKASCDPSPGSGCSSLAFRLASAAENQAEAESIRPDSLFHSLLTAVEDIVRAYASACLDILHGYPPAVI